MANDDLNQWITSGRKKGMKTEDLRKSLKDAGYTDNKIAAAFAKAGVGAPATKGGGNKLPLILGVVAVLVIIAVVAFSFWPSPTPVSTGGPELPSEEPIDFALWQQRIDEGWALLKGGDAAAAEATFREAIDLNYYDSLGHGSLGWALLTQGKDAAAKEAFLEVVELDPATPYGYLGLAVVYHRQDRLEEAKEMASTGAGIATEQQIDWVLQWDSGFRSLLE